MWDVKVKITPINKDLKTIEINGEKSKFIFDDNRYTIKMMSMVNMVFFPKGFILKVNWTNKIFIKLINTITIRVA